MHLFYISVGVAALCLPLPSIAHSHHDHDHGHEHHDHDHDHDDSLIALTDEQITKAGVGVATARPGHLIQRLRAPGRVAWPQHELMHVVPQLSGTVAAVNKKIGDTVTGGELLALLDSRECGEAKADYLGALNRQHVKETIYNREQQLAERRLNTDQEYWQAYIELAEAKINYELARQKLLAMGFSPANIDALVEAMRQGDNSSLRRYEIRAPQNGTILSQNIALGQYIGPDRDAYILGTPGRQWIEIDLPATKHSSLDQGSAVVITPLHGEGIRGYIHCCNPHVEEKTRTIKLYATMEGPCPWPAGTFVTAIIDTDMDHHKLVILKEAVQKVDGHEVVFVRREGGFEIRPVTLGASDDERVAVLHGLSRGERYATTHSFLLKAEHEKDEAAHEH